MMGIGHYTMWGDSDGTFSLQEWCLRTLKYQPVYDPQYNQLCGPDTYLGQCLPTDLAVYRQQHHRQFHHRLKRDLARHAWFNETLLDATLVQEFYGPDEDIEEDYTSIIIQGWTRLVHGSQNKKPIHRYAPMSCHEIKKRLYDIYGLDYDYVEHDTEALWCQINQQSGIRTAMGARPE